MIEEYYKKFGLTQKQYNLVEGTIISFREIQKVLIFGSRATGKFAAASDIDLAVIGENISSNIINRFSSELEDLPLPFMFDILNYNEVSNMALKRKIDSYSKIFFERKLKAV